MNRVEKNRAIFTLPEYCKEDSLEMDQESNGSSAEDGESPRSVAVDKRRKCGQIMRIKEEGLHLAEDVAEGKLFLKDEYGLARYVVFSRPILPASPLSGKTAHYN